VLTAVSGGPDSVALFHALDALAAKFGLRLGIAHLNHCIRQEEADRDARFVSAMARRFNVPFHMDTVDVPGYATTHKRSIEEAGRQVRMAFLNGVADKYGYGKIALGHHADDNAELILMYLIRGSGPLGLSGMLPIRDGRIARPLIEQSRADILAFLHESRIDYVEDTSNADPRYLRNRIRHHLIPMLKAAYNPNIVESLNRLSHILRSEDQWGAAVARTALEQILLKKEKGRLTLSVETFLHHPVGLKRRIIRTAIEIVKGNLRRIRFSHIEAIRHLAASGPPDGRLDLPGRIRVSRQKDRLYIDQEDMPLRSVATHSPDKRPPCFQYTLLGPDTVRVRETGQVLSVCPASMAAAAHMKDAGHTVAFFDMDAVQFPLTLRTARPGDRFRPLGLKGTQKVKDFFINQKVPRNRRAACPILLGGDRIIWVAGYRIDDAVKITPATRRILKTELTLA